MTPLVRDILAKAKWEIGKVPAQTLVLPTSFAFSPTAVDIIKTYAGLEAGQWGPGEECGTSPVCIDPTLAIGREDTVQILERATNNVLSPLGETDHGYGLLLIDQNGGLYVYAELELRKVGESFLEGLDTLFRGGTGKKIIEFSPGEMT